MLVKERLYEVAMAKGLRQSTVVSYERLLGRIGLLDQEVDEVTQERALTALWTLDNPNTRRAAVIALRSVLGFAIRIPRGAPRRYDLPSEQDLRLAFMTSPHETRFLLMAFCGLRVGEACAVTASDLAGDRLRIDKQVLEITQTGRPTVVRLGPTKSAEAEVVVPLWLVPQIQVLDTWVKPSTVRESLRRAGRRIGLDLNPHQLRHWMASTALERGVSLIVVSRALRHSHPSITLATYAQGNDGTELHRAFG